MLLPLPLLLLLQAPPAPLAPQLWQQRQWARGQQLLRCTSASACIHHRVQAHAAALWRAQLALRHCQPPLRPCTAHHCRQRTEQRTGSWCREGSSTGAPLKHCSRHAAQQQGVGGWGGQLCCRPGCASGQGCATAPARGSACCCP